MAKVFVRFWETGCLKKIEACADRMGLRHGVSSTKALTFSTGAFGLGFRV